MKQALGSQIGVVALLGVALFSFPGCSNNTSAFSAQNSVSPTSRAAQGDVRAQKAKPTGLSCEITDSVAGQTYLLDVPLDAEEPSAQKLGNGDEIVVSSKTIELRSEPGLEPGIEIDMSGVSSSGSALFYRQARILIQGDIQNDQGQIGTTAYTTRYTGASEQVKCDVVFSPA